MALAKVFVERRKPLVFWLVVLSLLAGCQDNTPLPPQVVSIQVTPANSTIVVGATQQFTATATFSDNTTGDITSTAGWSSANTAVATINSSGLATAVAPGSTTIFASSGLEGGSTTLTVTAVVPIVVPIKTSDGVNGLLRGGYVVSLRDEEFSFALAGRLQADGEGRLSGVMDVVRRGQARRGSAMEFEGTYALESSGHGKLTLLPAGGEKIEFQIAVVSNNLVRIVAPDSATVPVTGRLERQVAVQRPLLHEAELQLHGYAPQGRVSTTGRLTEEMAGAVKGEESLHDLRSSTSHALRGVFSQADGNGRGEAQLQGGLGKIPFTFYVVSQERVILLGQDGMVGLEGWLGSPAP